MRDASLDFYEIGGVVEVIVLAYHAEKTEGNEIIFMAAVFDGMELDGRFEIIDR